MKKVTIYTTDYCPFCTRAKNFLRSRNIPFDEVDVTNNEPLRDRLEEETGWQTVPMIFIGKEFIGGADDLDILAESGELDRKLQDEGA